MANLKINSKVYENVNQISAKNTEDKDVKFDLVEKLGLVYVGEYDGDWEISVEGGHGKLNLRNCKNDILAMADVLYEKKVMPNRNHNFMLVLFSNTADLSKNCFTVFPLSVTIKDGSIDRTTYVGSSWMFMYYYENMAPNGANPQPVTASYTWEQLGDDDVSLVQFPIGTLNSTKGIDGKYTIFFSVRPLA